MISNIKRNQSWKYSKFDEKYKPADLRDSMGPKQKKDEENDTKVHHHQTAQNQK